MTEKPAYNGKVLVAGATGKTGTWIVRRLQHYGVPVRVLVRSAEKAGPLGNVDVVTGKIQNPEDIAQAVRGCSAVISALGSSQMFGEASPGEVDRDGVIRLAEEAAKAGVKHFGLVSSIAVTKWFHPLNLFGGVLSMKLAGEDHLRKVFSQDGRSYTIVRPGGLQDGDPFEYRLKVDQGDRIWNGFTNRSDVAELLVLSLWNEKARNTTFEVVSEDKEPQQSLDYCFEGLTQG
ncbi:SDR family oxidoreductase [Prosthecochloris sp. N3]|uniref:SDR family oxidoreductase n=1 Tax=Prosthecochloris ethylica TaxID=2743976 RepID=A0ABR9XQV7_9CHLB|nr:SDR family oxidoreductase [Prosthecochloris ethylica]MBF0586376.1 SDR family oxidoreductase [Prosthecochloris ethylica]MBF0636406.1 SDR family oxidoreductase [Prosthecochloris ethylica]NUK47580.1 SDR family oxidoreductase [Prosthecochloris ethylica]